MYRAPESRGKAMLAIKVALDTSHHMYNELSR